MRKLLPFLLLVSTAQAQAQTRAGLIDWHENASGMSAGEYAVPMGIMNPGKGHLNRSGQGWLSGGLLGLLNRRVSLNG